MLSTKELVFKEKPVKMPTSIRIHLVVNISRMLWQPLVTNINSNIRSKSLGRILL